MDMAFTALVWIALSAMLIFSIWSHINGTAKKIGVFVLGIVMGWVLASWLLASFGVAS
jgi:hypothetical protein